MMTKKEEVLLLLQEEAAEVIQAVSKVKRFGAENNINDLCKEIGDLMYIIELAKLHFPEIKNFNYTQHEVAKFEKLQKFSSLFKNEFQDILSTEDCVLDALEKVQKAGC